LAPEAQHTVRGPLRFLLPVTLLVAAPLLGVGGRAQAGYLAPTSLADQPRGDSFLAGAPQTEPDDMGAAASTDTGITPNSDPNENKDERTLLRSLPAPGSPFGASSGGAGAPPPSNGPGAQGGQAPALTARPPADAPALVGALFLEAAQRRPPPFPSRLFRPPRLS
jgi:hypothetical protein